MAEPNSTANQGSTFNTILKMFKYLVLFMAIKSLAGFLFTPKNIQHSPNSENDHIDLKNKLTNIWPSGQLFDFELHHYDVKTNKHELLVSANGLKYEKPGANSDFLVELNLAKWINAKTKSFPIILSVYRSGLSPKHSDENNGNDPLYFRNTFDLVKLMSDKGGLGQNLLFGDKPQPAADKSIKNEKVAFLNDDINIKLVFDQNSYRPDSIPKNLENFLRLTTSHYFPIVYDDNFWTLQADLRPLHNLTDSSPVIVRFRLGTMSLTKFIFKTGFDQSFDLQSQMLGGMEGEKDNLKRILRDTNPYFLALTMIVSLLHFCFEILAFKNEISFWKENSSLHGLSVRTIFVELFCSVVISLYLYENETSWMIVASSFFTVALYVWKLKKAFLFKLNLSGGLANISQWVTISVKTPPAGSSASNSDKYDRVAVKYLCMALLPLAACYSLYSLFYEDHKGWYQWVLNSLVGSVYTFGFIMMCPQLYINYKLKSVAHLPWRMMTYKALNTVIDDLFAFIIKMPILHRISCFRDDLVFAIFLYQKWKYGVDYSRTNEFGYTPGNEANAGSKSAPVVEESKEKKD